MAHEGQETISIGNYLLERLSQIGVQAGSNCSLPFLARFSLNVQSLFGVPGDFNLGESPFPYSLLSRYIDGHSGFLVCPATILHALLP